MIETQRQVETERRTPGRTQETQRKTESPRRYKSVDRQGNKQTKTLTLCPLSSFLQLPFSLNASSSFLPQVLLRLLLLQRDLCCRTRVGFFCQPGLSMPVVLFPSIVPIVSPKCKTRRRLIEACCQERQRESMPSRDTVETLLHGLLRKHFPFPLLFRSIPSSNSPHQGKASFSSSTMSSPFCKHALMRSSTR